MKILDIPQSGKRGLYVSQNGRYGQISRILAIPANPRTSGQLDVRQRLAKFTQAWRGLTPNQRTAWILAAKNHQSKARCGQSGPLTGGQFFVRINCNLAIMGASSVVVPPAAVTFPTLVPSSLEVTNTLGVLAIKMVCGDDPTEYTMIRASAPQSAGINACSDFRLLGECPQPVLGKADITSLYVNKFGDPGVGAKIFVRANQMIDGYEDFPRQFEASFPPHPNPNRPWAASSSPRASLPPCLI